MGDNPFEPDYEPPQDAPAPAKVSAAPPDEEPEHRPGKILITEPGAYADIAAEDYHDNPRLLPGPSISSSGIKLIDDESPFHFWSKSNLNPNRPKREEKQHFSVGKAAHDVILLEHRWKDFYHVLPEGFAWNKTAKFGSAIQEAEEALADDMTLIKKADADMIRAMGDAIRKNKLAMACLMDGVPEETLCWKDPVTGVWLRARPDFRPNSVKVGREVMVVPDLKFMDPRSCPPAKFEKAVHEYGYHRSAALYCDGLHAIYGNRPTHWLHMVIEKAYPWSVSFYELPGEDIERGRIQNRLGINTFARCLEKNHWPSYADEPRPAGLPIWARMRIDEASPEEHASAEAG